jgi:hypothetical protein
MPIYFSHLFLSQTARQITTESPLALHELQTLGGISGREGCSGMAASVRAAEMLAEAVVSICIR